MNFEKDHIYHIYNQGNNKQKIFFINENYYFFIHKIKTHVLQFADILAWCLMPNHFHIMVYVNNPELTFRGTNKSRSQARNETVGVTDNSTGQARSHPDSSKRSLNNSIGIMLRSYTRAVNIQEKRSGALFREETKAECMTNSSGITPAFFNTNNGTLINIPLNAKEYPQICFDYIHNNPVKAGLVANPEEWEFSSFREFFGEKILVNKTRVMQLKLKYLPDIGLQTHFN
ncbi:MAG TPA: hypothetical protein PLI16_05780 [Bacteroidales bacterium]|jgi:putative transposase|nr:hypothetical protein [Bacteroidales bacterium]HOH84105.1 hypothetical protein [Bacteroidales bacterium]HPB25991.1 hypothetical protein [Bacteroidales bacterium]HPI30516.1 hypothetical protein [Bacteroidales bacterium]HQN16625.1 hypothetical protein [Bacteroidales bacterium]